MQQPSELSPTAIPPAIPNPSCTPDFVHSATAKWRTCGDHRSEQEEEEEEEKEEDDDADEHAPIRSASHLIASTSVRMSIRLVRQARPGIWAVQFPDPAVTQPTWTSCTIIHPLDSKSAQTGYLSRAEATPACVAPRCCP